MICALALAAGLTACGGGGFSADTLAAIAETENPASPGNLVGTTTNLDVPAGTTTTVATTDTTTTLAATDPTTTVATTGTPTTVVPTNSTTTVAPTNSTTPVGAYTLAALGSPRILISDSATLNRLRSLVNAQAPSAMRFKGLVDAQLGGGDSYLFQPWYAALMGQVNSNAAYCRYAVDETEKFVLSEEALIASNQRATVAGDSYLHVGMLIGNLSLVYDWCRATMTATQRTRWMNYANQAVWNVWNFQSARWGNASYPWSGWSVDNPSNNYYYSFLQATMFLGLATYGENSQAQTWLDTFRIAKIQNQLVPTFMRDLNGGGSREGTGYGTAMKSLFMLYDWWERSTGERIADLTPHAKSSLAHMMHSVVPTLNFLAPTGDQSRDSTAAFFDYHRDYLQILMRLYPGEAISGAAKTLMAESSVPKMGNGFMVYSDFLYDQSDITARPLNILSTAYWGSGTGQFPMRSSWAKDATYANFICGPFDESHAHQDQGSFVLYKGTWLAFDPNQVSHNGTWGIFNEPLGTALHNIVRIEQNGTAVSQTWQTTCEMAALANTPSYSYGLARVTPNYKGKASVVRVEREFLLIKPGALVIMDRVQTSGAGAQRIWTLNLPQAPAVNGDRLTMVSGANRLDVIRLAPAGLPTKVVAWPSVNPDFNSGVRVDVADATGDSSVFLNVLGTDGAVVNAVRSDAAGQTGAQISLADGSIATIRFSTTGSGGTIDIRSRDGTVITSGALPTDVRAPPVYQ